MDGVDLTHKDTQLRQIRQKVGMVFQYPEHQLFGETVLEDVASGRGTWDLLRRKLWSGCAGPWPMLAWTSQS